MNRRLAEHKNRKGNASAENLPAQPAAPGNSRAAQAAARVAARFAKAPTYSQLQAEEARIAVREAEIATQVALKAQSAAETALAELHAATVEPVHAEPAILIPFEAARAIEPVAQAYVEQPAVVHAPEWDWATDQVVAGHAAAHEPTAPVMEAVTVAEPVAVEPVAAPVIEPKIEARIAEPPAPAVAPVALPDNGPLTDAKASSGQVLQIRWEPDMQFRSEEREPEKESFELAAEDWWTAAEPVAAPDEPVHVEAHTIQANLIEFPRELIATRRIRPRNVEGPADVQSGTQLSIFEVDPETIQTEAPAEAVAPVRSAAWTEAEPLLSHAQAVAEPAAEASSQAADWSTPEWSGMKLGAQSRHEVAAPSLRDKLSLAPLHTRLMAGVVDTAVVVAVASFAWLTLALGMSHSLAPRLAEGMGAGAIVLVGLLYHAFFCMLAIPSLGMRYAGLSLCTFDNMFPTPEQLRRRFAAMALSMLPMGLGMAWSLFDEDHLAWHDRYSQTYLRKN